MITLFAALVLVSWLLPRIFARHCLNLVKELVASGFVPNTKKEDLTHEQARVAVTIGRWVIAGALTRLLFWPSVIGLLVATLV